MGFRERKALNDRILEETVFPLLERVTPWRVVGMPTVEEDIAGIDAWVEHFLYPGVRRGLQVKTRFSGGDLGLEVGGREVKPWWYCEADYLFLVVFGRQGLRWWLFYTDDILDVIWRGNRVERWCNGGQVVWFVDPSTLPCLGSGNVK